MEPVFTPPRGLDRSRPRETRLSGVGRALVVVIALLLAGAPTVGVVLARVAAAQAAERQRLVDDGVETQGVVTRLWSSSGDSKQWRVAYRFEADGQPYAGQSKIPRAWSQTLRAGRAVTVRFVRDDPGVNLPGGLEPAVLPFWLPYPAAALLAGVGFVGIINLRRQRELLANGRAAGAVVTRHATHRTGHGGAHRTMSYEFREFGGATVKGKSATSRKPPAIGSVICVLYDPERPTRNQPYPLGLVRLEEG